jgi:hypothetical protein
LKYEHDGYTELAKGMPKKGEYCETPDGAGRISDRNLLSRKVFVALENGNVNQYSVDDVKIIPSPERRYQGPKKGQERPQKTEKNGEDSSNHHNGGKKEGRSEKRPQNGNPKHHHSGETGADK